MGKKFQVNTEEMDRAARKLQESSENYTRIYKQLLNAAETMGQMWEGEDNLKFVEQIKGTADDLQKMATKMQENSQTLLSQKQLYENQVQENISNVGKLKN